MTQDKIPFSVDLWQKGYKVVTRDGREMENLRHQFGWLLGTIDGFGRVWYTSGAYLVGRETPFDLFLLPPDEIVVEVRNYMKLADGTEVTKCAKVFDASKVPPGKYKLVKIG